MSTRRATLRIHGKVQGVWFRESARQQAERLGLTGRVRNRTDGTVEAIAEGPPEALEDFVRWCHQGPPAAEVARVERTDEPPRGDFPSFTVERTS